MREVGARVRLGPHARELLDLQRGLERGGELVAAAEDDDRVGAADAPREARRVGRHRDGLVDRLRQARERQRAPPPCPSRPPGKGGERGHDRGDALEQVFAVRGGVVGGAPRDQRDVLDPAKRSPERFRVGPSFFEQPPDHAGLLGDLGRERHRDDDDQYFRLGPTGLLSHRATGESLGDREREEAHFMKDTLGSTPPTRRRWRRTLRRGLFWTALGLAAAALAYALDQRALASTIGVPPFVVGVLFSLVPLPALGVGLRALARALRLRGASELADAVAKQLEGRLPGDYVVLSHYAPRDDGEAEVAVVVVGPPGVVVVEPRR